MQLVSLEEKEISQRKGHMSTWENKSDGLIRIQWAGHHLQDKERGLNRNQISNTLILDFQAPELWENKISVRNTVSLALLATL